MTGQIVGDTEWNGLPMPRRLWAILAVTFGVALSVLATLSMKRTAELVKKNAREGGFVMPGFYGTEVRIASGRT